MDLQLKDEDFKTLVAKAIFDSLTPIAREKLITDAVAQSLQQTETSGYGSRKQRSPIQLAFDNAVVTYANQYAKEILQNDPTFKTKIEGLFVDVSTKLFEDQREDLVEGIVKVIRDALTKDRY